MIDGQHNDRIAFDKKVNYKREQSNNGPANFASDFVSNRAFASSHETTSVGFSKWSRRRRSISSASPEESESPKYAYSSSMLSTTFRCSSSGRRRICSKISAALMISFCRVGTLRQSATKVGRISTSMPNGDHLNFAMNGVNSERHLLKRSRISTKTCSTGLPLPGCFNASSARRFSSTASSGKSESPKYAYSSSILSTTFRCSSSGRRRICSKISAALMMSVYRVGRLRQVSFWCHYLKMLASLSGTPLGCSLLVRTNRHRALSIEHPASNLYSAHQP